MSRSPSRAGRLALAALAASCLALGKSRAAASSPQLPDAGALRPDAGPGSDAELAQDLELLRDLDLLQDLDLVAPAPDAGSESP